MSEINQVKYFVESVMENLREIPEENEYVRGVYEGLKMALEKIESMEVKK